MTRYTLVFAIAMYLSIGAVTAASAQTDPLAELEAWNKIKESSVAADYQAFLQKFPNGTLAARAREKMNSLGDPVWNELKKSNDPFKYRDYIKANPNSPFLDQAKARLEVLGPAAIEWEKVKAVGDMRLMMRFISANPSGPFASEAKALLEPKLWETISISPTDDLLEFYSRHYSTSDRGREAATKLAASKAEKRSIEYQAIRSRIAAQNGVKITRQHTGYPATEHWYENKVLDVCTLETTEFDRNTYKGILDYVAKSYRMDLNKVRKVYPGTATSWGYSIALSGGASDYASPSDNKFSGISQFYKKKSTTASGVPSYAPQALSESYIVVLSTYDSSIATRFAADLAALVQLCKESK